MLKCENLVELGASKGESPQGRGSKFRARTGSNIPSKRRSTSNFTFTWEQLKPDRGPSLFDAKLGVPLPKQMKVRGLVRCRGL